MRFIVTMVYILTSFLTLGQTKFYFQDMRFDDGTLQRFSLFDEEHDRYEVFHLSQLGDTIFIERMDTNGYANVDTSFGFHHNGCMASYRVYKNGTQHGGFQVYDTLHNLRFTGAFYDGIRIGTWTSYSAQGDLEQETEYAYSRTDFKLLEEHSDSLKFYDTELVYDTVRLNYRSDVWHNTYFDLVLLEASFFKISKIKNHRKKQDDHFFDQFFSDGLIEN